MLAIRGFMPFYLWMVPLPNKQYLAYQGGKDEKGFSEVIYCQLNPVHSFFSLHIILLNTIIMNGRDVNWTSSSYISTREDLLSEKMDLVHRTSSATHTYSFAPRRKF
jgi:hypothetical protein